MAGALAAARLTLEVQSRLDSLSSPADIASAFVTFPEWVTSVFSAPSAPVKHVLMVVSQFHNAMTKAFQSMALGYGHWRMWEVTVRELHVGVPLSVLEANTNVAEALSNMTLSLLQLRRRTTMFDLCAARVGDLLLDITSREFDSPEAVLLEICAVRLLADFHPAVAHLTYRAERRVLESAVLPTCSDEAYEAKVRATFREEFAVPHAQLKASQEEYKAFEVDEAMLQRHLPRLTKQIETLHGELWVQRLLKWTAEHRPQLYQCAEGDDPAKSTDERRTAYNTAMERLEAVTEGMFRAGQATSAFMCELDALCSPAAAKFGVDVSRASRVLKYLANIPSPPSSSDTPKAGLTIDQEARWGAHHHLAILCRQHDTLHSLPVKHTCLALNFLRTSAEVAVDGRSDELTVALKRTWLVGVVEPLRRRCSEPLDGLRAQVEWARSTPAAGEAAGAFEKIACEVFTLLTTEAARRLDDPSEIDCILIEACVKSAENGRLPATVKRILESADPPRFVESARCVANILAVCGGPRIAADVTKLQLLRHLLPTGERIRTNDDEQPSKKRSRQ